jgi:hypothetical protein
MIKKTGTVRLNAATATTKALHQVVDLGMHLAPEGDMLGALDVARLHIEQGKAPKYVEREPGSFGAWRIDDSEAIAEILAMTSPACPRSKATATVARRRGANTSTVRRWRKRLAGVEPDRGGKHVAYDKII